MERDELEGFLTLAEELHFGRTAERMRLSRARVSQLIQRLERRLGAPLFERTSRRVVLTELGRRFREEVEPHHRAIEDAFARAAASARGLSGTLRVGFSAALTGEIAMRAVDRLREAYPELAVEICEMSFTDPFGQVRERYYDVQFMELPVREDDLAKGPTLLTEGRVLAVAAHHPLAARPWLTMEDLSATDLVSVEGDMPDYRRDLQAPARTPSGRPIGSGPAVTSLQEALMLVAGDRGALLTGAHTAVYQPRPGVVYLEVVDAPPVRYGLVWRAGEDTDAVRAFTQQVAVEAETASTPAIAPAELGKSPALLTE
ncbi:LysR family transcriptional regulator [Glycomyces sp. TRM65418]|uniref:LysR family transcriptional regulator n=1 Tax=Glycomyces sp. TRM65418 TaxID=2867006 RepID=UPI001CE6E1F9|nr:LysR family transcriptional regulator [Glycomyces sp. TRM65418]MCC3765625.1 LysR family transcriptional regulator [Glycomyces sp. TRM65418]QZD55224.1 LysR family transcriptional regulator [Glycomyces sp. TRM65418]